MNTGTRTQMPLTNSSGNSRILRLSLRSFFSSSVSKRPSSTKLPACGITSNAICPGFVHTPLVQIQIEDRARELGISPEKAARDVILAPQPTKEFVKVEDIAAMALYLAGPNSAGINGASFSIDGGWTAR